jgi:hypothetical protein
MGNAVEVEYALEVAIVLKILGQTAIVGFEEGFEGKASKELRLRVDMGAEPTGIRTEHQRSRSQRLSGNTQRGFTQRAHGLLEAGNLVRDSSFLQSRSVPLAACRNPGKSELVKGTNHFFNGLLEQGKLFLGIRRGVGLTYPDVFQCTSVN